MRGPASGQVGGEGEHGQCGGGARPADGLRRQAPRARQGQRADVARRLEPQRQRRGHRRVLAQPGPRERGLVGPPAADRRTAQHVEHRAAAEAQAQPVEGHGELVGAGHDARPTGAARQHQAGVLDAWYGAAGGVHDGLVHLAAGGGLAEIRAEHALRERLGGRREPGRVSGLFGLVEHAPLRRVDPARRS
nr:hypothetical protein [Angustibacter aerolatus]